MQFPLVLPLKYKVISPKAKAISGTGSTIRDTGSGIPAGQREKVFELYFSTKEKGSGLGLPMAYRALQLHGGSIDLESKPGKGTSFHLKLPVMEAEGFS